MGRRLVAALIFLLLCSSAFADFSDFYYQWSSFFSPLIDPNAGLTLFPSLFIPMGGNNEGMGTAFTAVANDISYIEVNPAASAMLSRSELAFLHHSWIMDSNIESVIYTTRWDDLGFGASAKLLYVPFVEKDGWGRDAGKGYYIETIGTVNVSYNLFSDYYFPGVAVGANVKIAYMGFPDTIISNESVLTGMIDVGILTRFNFLKFYSSSDGNFSIGAAFKNFSPIPTPEPVPTIASFGISYSPIRPLILAVDFNLPISLDPAVPAERFYFAGGFSIAFSPFVGLQGGIKIKGGNPMISLGATIDLDSVSFVVNYNVDLTNSLDPLDKFSISAKFNLGDGGRAENRKAAEALYIEGVRLYADRKIEDAIKKWEEVLKLDPKFTPARDYIEIAKKSLELDREIVEKQKFE